MVPVALLSARVAPAVGFDRVTVKVSSPSTDLSPATSSVMVLENSSAAKSIVPLSTPLTSSALAPPVPPGRVTE